MKMKSKPVSLGIAILVVGFLSTGCSSVPNTTKQDNFVLSNQLGALVKTIDVAGFSYDLFVKGNYAYVGASANGVKIINIANPEKAYIEKTIITAKPAGSINIHGDYLYVAMAPIGTINLGESGPAPIYIFNIRDPINPILVKEGTGNVSNGSFDEKYGYFGQGGGLIIEDIIDPSKPARRISFAKYGGFDTYAYNNYCYITNGFREIKIIDTTNLDKYMNTNDPDLVKIDMDGYALFGIGNILYATIDAGFNVLDISNPLKPEIIGSCIVKGITGTRYIFVKGNYAFMSSGDNELRIVDVKDPRKPAFLGSIQTNGPCFGVYVEGKYCYVANGKNGLAIIKLDTL